MNNSQDLFVVRMTSSSSSSSSLPSEKFFFDLFCFMSFSRASWSEASSESELCIKRPRVCWLELLLVLLPLLLRGRFLGLVLTIMYCCFVDGIGNRFSEAGFSSGIVESLYIILILEYCVCVRLSLYKFLRNICNIFCTKR